MIFLTTLLVSLLFAEDNNISSYREKAREFYNVSGMNNWKIDFSNKMYSIQLLAHANEIDTTKLKEIVARTTLKFENDINIQSIQLIWKQFSEVELDTLINLFRGKIGKKLLALDSLVAKSDDINKLYSELSNTLSDEIKKAINTNKR